MREYEKQLNSRDRVRRGKKEREDNYAGQIETFYNEKFE